jgi:4-amino-4-deoxy-L-arabinose transferase-like glycosyltransferase
MEGVGLARAGYQLQQQGGCGMAIVAEQKAFPRARAGQPLFWLQALVRPAEHTRSALLILIVLCGFLFFYGLNVGELWRTESLRAIIAAEFLDSGNWIVPILYGNPLLTKPPGTYAAIALVSWPFGGVQEWTARLPSALAATLTVLLVYWYFGRQLGRRGGLVAAVLLPISMMWLDKATSAEIDMLQVAWVTAAILFFLRALEEEEKEPTGRRPWAWRDHSSSWFWWLASLICVAGGLLTKWTAPAFFYGTVIPLLWHRKQLRLLWGRRHLVAAAVGAGICLAWMAAAVALAGWDNFVGTVGQEAAMRLLPSHHHRPYPWGEVLLHPFKVWAASLPLSVFALPALWPGFARLWDQRGQRLLAALHCWIWPNLVFWSIIPEKATRHSFPLYPAIAGLAAMVWLAWLTGRLPWPWKRIGPAKVLVAGVVLWLGVKLAFVHAVIPARNQNREPRAKGELLARLVPPGETLYLLRLKDEGIMFYYGRPVRRLPSFAGLPSSGRPVYCILDVSEWRKWQGYRVARAAIRGYAGLAGHGRDRSEEVLRRLSDEQGDPIILVKVQER